MKKWIILLVLIFSPLVCWAGVDLDGTNGYIDINGAAASFELSSLTVSLWVNLDADNIRYDAISKHGGTSVAGTRSGWSFFRDNVDETFYWSCAENSNWHSLQSATAVTAAGGEYHLVGVFADADYQRFYINGVEDAADEAVTHSIAYTVSLDPIIGANSDTAYYFFNGTINEVAIWNTPLTASEVSLLYNSKIKGMPYQIQPTNLVGYWPLDDFPNGTNINTQTFKDRAGTNDGTGSDAGGESVTVGESVLSYPSPILGGN